MNDFTLKLVLSLLTGMVFSLLFILLAFVLPIEKKKSVVIKTPKNKLEKISNSLK